jgi:hypothetical protein
MGLCMLACFVPSVLVGVCSAWHWATVLRVWSEEDVVGHGWFQPATKAGRNSKALRLWEVVEADVTNVATPLLASFFSGYCHPPGESQSFCQSQGQYICNGQSGGDQVTV